jgi:hypothetical protein
VGTQSKLPPRGYHARASSHSEEATSYTNALHWLSAPGSADALLRVCLPKLAISQPRPGSPDYHSAQLNGKACYRVLFTLWSFKTLRWGLHLGVL